MFKFRPHTTLLLIICIACCGASCSGKKEKRPSPLTADSVSIGDTKITIEYSSPSVRKRKIWGELVPYDEVWRTGANKATYLTTNKDIEIEGHYLPTGRYSIFTIPSDSSWTVIFNEDWDQWGAYNYSEQNDVFRIQVFPQKSSFDERMKFVFEDGSLRFDWEELSYSLAITTDL